MFKQGIYCAHITVILILCACIAGCRNDKGNEPGPEATSESSESKPVYLESARRMTFASVLSPSGNVQAKNSAYVSARIPGTLDRIFVDEGDTVIAGDTDLFQTDSLKLGKAVEASRKDLAVAEYTVLERQANLEQVQADYNKVKLDYERYKRLYEQDKAVTKNAFEIIESQFLQVSAAQKHAEISVELAQKRQEQARANLAIAEKDLRDSLVQAPISGAVTERMMEPGEMAAAGTPVLRIVDLSIVEISAYLPEEAYARVLPGKTKVHIDVGDKQLRNQPISYKSSTVSSDLRTFEIRCDIRRPPEGIVPGRIARLEVTLESREGLGVPRESIVVRADGLKIFISDGDTVRMIPVRTGLETNGWIEILEGDLRIDSRVVTAGKDLLQDGDRIAVIRKDR
ncbi:MAG: efflux RND transporter periplasmic adaptor subunit [Acidobacteria bacterium]|nr:efflux RND transporter periplasmic adaptor subunit [Acidobacteriota bacterium]